MAEVTNSTLLEVDTGIRGADACIVIVRTDWNAAVVDELERGCRHVLSAYGVRDVRVLNVPGAFEIPFAIKNYWEVKKNKENSPSAFIALGCVIRGDTPHFEYVCKAVTDGIVQLNLLISVPTVFGILTVDNQHQAAERIGGKHGHKGEEAAVTALKMIALQNSINQ